LQRAFSAVAEYDLSTTRPPSLQGKKLTSHPPLIDEHGLQRLSRPQEKVGEGELLANQVVHPKDNSLETILKAWDGASDSSLEADRVPFKFDVDRICMPRTNKKQKEIEFQQELIMRLNDQLTHK
jgi:hypothetical protein